MLLVQADGTTVPGNMCKPKSRRDANLESHIKWLIVSNWNTATDTATSAWRSSRGLRAQNIMTKVPPPSRMDGSERSRRRAPAQQSEAWPLDRGGEARWRKTRSSEAGGALPKLANSTGRRRHDGERGREVAPRLGEVAIARGRADGDRPAPARNGRRPHVAGRAGGDRERQAAHAFMLMPRTMPGGGVQAGRSPMPRTTRWLARANNLSSKENMRCAVTVGFQSSGKFNGSA